MARLGGMTVGHLGGAVGSNGDRRVNALLPVGYMGEQPLSLDLQPPDALSQRMGLEYL